jgi:predicted Rossmann-fold nucleotide-binding protein
VVFGSTRLQDSELACQRLADAEQTAARLPEDDAARDALRRARNAAEQSRYYAIAREFGQLVGRCGDGPHDDRLLIVTGGGPARWRRPTAARMTWVLILSG